MNRPQPGRGTRVMVTAQGYTYSAEPAGATYLHPFRPSLVGKRVKFALGTVEGRQPTINGVPIGGRGGLVPSLALDPAVANENGESWVCVEVHPDEDGNLPADSEMELVHTDTPRSIDPDLGRLTLCMILWRNRSPFRVMAIAMFNLGYARVLPPDGAGAVRHLAI